VADVPVGMTKRTGTLLMLRTNGPPCEGGPLSAEEHRFG
jgi:hypothetical protein